MRPFEQVVADHGRTVYRICAALTGPGEAEDAWSETFLAALEAYPRLSPDANIEAWLVTIARRKAIDLLRRRSRQAQPVAEPPPDRHEPAADAGLVDRSALGRAVSALPVRQRHAVAYHYVGGLSYGEVAGLLGGSPDAARRAAADGLKTLRRTLQPEGMSR